MPIMQVDVVDTFMGSIALSVMDDKSKPVNWARNFMEYMRQSGTLVFVLVASAVGCAGSPSDGAEGSPAPGPGPVPATSAESMFARPVTPSKEEWRKAISRRSLPKEGCFRASHPSMTWEEVPCGKAPDVPYRPTKSGAARRAAGAQIVGNGTDYSAETPSAISWAEGSFPSVTGVTSVTDGSANNFSLQLNSNFFTGSSMCNGAASPASCLAWEQFVYAPGAIFIQYWLINYNSTCPSGWNTFGGDCWRNSASSAAVPTQAATNLANITLTGTAGAVDGIAMSTWDGVVHAASQSSIIGLSQSWTAAEFNIFGDGGGSEAVFNSGATLTVQTLTNMVSGSAVAPVCEASGTTGETNNLTIVANSCCPIAGATPGIQFTESNVPGATAPACKKTVETNPDLLWWNQGTGQLSSWLLNNGTVEGTENLSWTCSAASGCAAAWRPVDPKGNTLLWDNPTTGGLSTWVWDPTGSVGALPNYSWTCTQASGCASSWRPIGRLVEGTQHGLVWYQASSGLLSIWDLTGTTVTGNETVSWTCGGSCASSWQAMLTADMNNDGNTDIVWYNPTSGVVSTWLLSGATVIGAQNLSWQCTAASGCAAAWKIIGAADVNNDGHTDLSWYNAATGQISSWLLDGSGNVLGTQLLSWQCTQASGCASAWQPLGYIAFP